MKVVLTLIWQAGEKKQIENGCVEFREQTAKK
jgi:hypothetical protein